MPELPFGNLSIPTKTPLSKRLSSSSIGHNSTAASNCDLSKNDTDLSDNGDFSAMFYSHASKSHQVSVDSLNSLQKAEDEAAVDANALSSRLEKVTKTEKPRIKVMRVCHTYSSSDKEETPVSSMFERGYYRPANRWVI